MKRCCRVLLPLLCLTLVPATLAGEHQFGLRVGNTNFGDPTREPALTVEEELLTRFFPPGCPDRIDSDEGDVLPAGCPAVPDLTGMGPMGGVLEPTGQILNEGVHIDRPIDNIRTIMDFRRDFDPQEFEGTFIAASYEWRRDTDAHFSLQIDAGVFSTDATHAFGGNIEVQGDPLDFDGDGVTQGAEHLPALFTDRLEYTVYFTHITPRYNFTTGKLRAFAGVGLGLWANLWREVISAEFQNITCDPDLEACSTLNSFRESDGDRRTIIPFSISAGLTYQFLPHWSFNIEDRWMFSADSNATMFRSESDFDISGNQLIIGFSYRL